MSLSHNHISGIMAKNVLKKKKIDMVIMNILSKHELLLNVLTDILRKYKTLMKRSTDVSIIT